MFKKIANRFKRDMMNSLIRLPLGFVGTIGTIIGWIVAPVLLAYFAYQLPKDMYGLEYPWWVGVIIWFVIFVILANFVTNPKLQRVGMLITSVLAGATVSLISDGKYTKGIILRYFGVDFWTVKGFLISTLIIGGIFFVSRYIYIKLTMKYGSEKDIYAMGDDAVEHELYKMKEEQDKVIKRVWEEEAEYAAKQKAKAEAAAKQDKQKYSTPVTNLPPDE